jgi:SAM-dependent methyltransferase
MKNPFLSLLKSTHGKIVHSRRVEVISSIIANNLPNQLRNILDIGCGDGKLGKLIQLKSKNIHIVGVDIMERPTCEIEYHSYNGSTLPFENQSFDSVLFVDVLHHTNNIEKVIEESLKTSKEYFIIKDHLYWNKLDFLILKFMDWVGNAPHGVKIIYNFQNKKSWDAIFEKNNLEKVYYNDNLNLYPNTINWLFGRKMHFIAILKKK